MNLSEDFDRKIFLARIDKDVMKEYITNKKKLEEEPDDIKVNYYFAKHYYDSKRYEESLILLNKIIDIDPEIPNAYYYRALNYYEKDDFDKALNNLYKALEYEHNFSKLDSISSSNVYVYLSITYDELGDIRRTLIYLNKFIKSSGIEKTKYEDGKKRLSVLKIGKEKCISILKKTELPKVIKNLNMLFHIPSCTKCNDKNFIVLKSNTTYNGVEIKCIGCNKKIWINTDMTIPKEYIKLIKEWIELDKPFEITISSNYNAVKKKSRLNIPSSIRQEIWRRDEGKCVNCGSRENLEYDHIIPVSKGGSNTARNIELLCQKCNREETNKIQ